jgi:multisubunit Na+/H+ antiporter MnhE subunit
MKLFRKIIYILEFIGFYIIKLVQANLFIAYDIITPKMVTKPAFLNIPVEIKSDVGLLLFSNLLSMTPGSLCVDLSDDKKEMKVHILYHESKEKMQKEIAKIQDRIIRIAK